jgi:hypothetical protein
MKQSGLGHLRPFAHEYMDKWVQSTHFGASQNHFNTVHETTNILFGGGLDDVWENMETGELHIVDYKSTAQMGTNPKPLDEGFIAPPADDKSPDYKAGYRRQMDMYQWILRRKGYQVSDIGYFVYVDGQHNGIEGMLDSNAPDEATMHFKVAVIPYHGSDAWVEDALGQVKACLETPDCPEHHSACEYGSFLQTVREVTGC